MPYFYAYLLLINAAGFALMLTDKRKAFKYRWRIPERVLMGIAFLGGSIGSDIQVLAPMHRGLIGAQNLNKEIQDILNPGNQAQLERGGTVFRVHDKVMQTSNDYDKDVYNGDIGMIEDVDLDDGEVAVDFDGRTVAFLFGGQLALLSRIIYGLVGLAGLWCITLLFRTEDGRTPHQA